MPKIYIINSKLKPAFLDPSNPKTWDPSWDPLLPDDGRPIIIDLGDPAPPGDIIEIPDNGTPIVIDLRDPAPPEWRRAGESGIGGGSGDSSSPHRDNDSQKNEQYNADYQAILKRIFTDKYVAIRSKFLSKFYYKGLIAQEILMGGIAGNTVTYIKFADQTIYLGLALLQFSCESALLTKFGLRNDQSETLISALLLRLKLLETEGLKPLVPPQVPRYYDKYENAQPGFIIRDSIYLDNCKDYGVPENISCEYYEDPDHPHDRTHSSTFNALASDFITDRRTFNGDVAPSIDQMTHLLVGLWMVTRYSTNNQNRLDATNQAARIVDYLKAQNFNIYFPNPGTNRVPRGSLAQGMSIFISRMNEILGREGFPNEVIHIPQVGWVPTIMIEAVLAVFFGLVDFLKVGHMGILLKDVFTNDDKFVLSMVEEIKLPDRTEAFLDPVKATEYLLKEKQRNIIKGKAKAVVHKAKEYFVDTGSSPDGQLTLIAGAFLQEISLDVFAAKAMDAYNNHVWSILLKCMYNESDIPQLEGQPNRIINAITDSLEACPDEGPNTLYDTDKIKASNNWWKDNRWIRSRDLDPKHIAKDPNERSYKRSNLQFNGLDYLNLEVMRNLMLNRTKSVDTTGLLMASLTRLLNSYAMVMDNDRPERTTNDSSNSLIDALNEINSLSIINLPDYTLIYPYGSIIYSWIYRLKEVLNDLKEIALLDPSADTRRRLALVSDSMTILVINSQRKLYNDYANKIIEADSPYFESKPLTYSLFVISVLTQLTTERLYFARFKDRRANLLELTKKLVQIFAGFEKRVDNYVRYTRFGRLQCGIYKVRQPKYDSHGYAVELTAEEEQYFEIRTSYRFDGSTVHLATEHRDSNNFPVEYSGKYNPSSENLLIYEAHILKICDEALPQRHVFNTFGLSLKRMLVDTCIFDIYGPLGSRKPASEEGVNLPASGTIKDYLGTLNSKLNSDASNIHEATRFLRDRLSKDTRARRGIDALYISILSKHANPQEQKDLEDDLLEGGCYGTSLKIATSPGEQGGMHRIIDAFQQAKRPLPSNLDPWIKFFAENGYDAMLTKIISGLSPLMATREYFIELEETASNNERVQRTVSRHLPGLKYQPVPGDGHCLFNAVALHVGQNHEYLRGIVAAHIEHNMEQYSDVIQALNPNKTPEMYLQDLRQGIEWADNLEIAVLMKMLNRPIVVVEFDGKIRNLSNLIGGGDPIFVQYNGHNHYDALILTGEKNPKEIFEALTQLIEYSPNNNASHNIQAPFFPSMTNYYSMCRSGAVVGLSGAAGRLALTTQEEDRSSNSHSHSSHEHCRRVHHGRNQHGSTHTSSKVHSHTHQHAFALHQAQNAEIVSHSHSHSHGSHEHCRRVHHGRNQHGSTHTSSKVHSHTHQHAFALHQAQNAEIVPHSHRRSRGSHEQLQQTGKLGR